MDFAREILCVIFNSNGMEFGYFGTVVIFLPGITFSICFFLSGILQGDLRRRNGNGGSSNHERNEQILFPKPETLDYELPCDTSYPHHIGVCLLTFLYLEDTNGFDS